MSEPHDLRGPLKVLALLSLGALALLPLVLRPGVGLYPIRSVEAFVTPVLFLLFLSPAYFAFGAVPPSARRQLDGAFSGRTTRLLASMLTLVLLLLAVWIVFGSVLQAKWGIIDDHEIMYFLGTADRLPIRDIPAKLALTEVRGYGESLRFRPAYYLLRLLETAAWGKNPTLWYASRLSMLAAGAGLFWFLLRPVLGDLGGALLCAYGLSIQIWADTIGRLGPSEAYAVLGLPLYLLGLVRGLRHKAASLNQQAIAGVCVLVGGAVCIGSKENFLILILPTLYLCYWAVREKRYLLLGMALVTVLFSGYVGSSVVLATSRAGTDVYGNTMSTGGRLSHVLFDWKEHDFVTPFTALLALTAACALALLVPPFSQRKRKAVLRAFSWMVILCCFYLTQWIFYNGGWPSPFGHYNYPGVLYLPASFVVLFWLARELVSGFPWEKRARDALQLALVASLAAGIVVRGGFGPTTQALQANVQKTLDFTSHLETIVALLREDASMPLVVEGGDTLWADYEPVYGYARFLRSFGLANPVFLRLREYDSDIANSGNARQLIQDLERISAGDMYYSPLSQLDDEGGKCYSLFLSREYATACIPIRQP